MRGWVGFSLGLLVVLGVIAVIGHGIWVAVASAVRWLAGYQDRSTRSPRGVCHHCGTNLAADATGCSVCGWPQQLSPEARRANVLSALVRELNRYKSAGLLDEPCVARLKAALAAEQAALATPAHTPAADLVPVELVVAEAVEAPAAATAPAQSSHGSTDELITSPPAAAPAATLDPAARVQQYLARQAELRSRPEPVSVEPPRKPARPWSEIFKAFLEEKNIRWGELVGGLLIVCCSIALVISFWSAIAQRPLLKFLVFTGVTAGLFGMGFYTGRRLQLPNTSQGLLLIATLLAPLNFLAIAAFTGRGPSDVVTLAGELFSIVIFATLVYLAGRSITAPWPVALVVGVMGTSVSQLLIRRFIDEDSTAAELYTWGAVPLACFAASALWPLLYRPRETAPTNEDTGRVVPMLRLLGIALFAVVLPGGLLLVKSGAPAGALRILAPLVSLSAIPLLAVGLSLWQRTTLSASWRTTGTAVAVFGALLWLAGLALAWPDPLRMLAVATIGFALFTAIAWRCDLYPAHAVATACLTLAVPLVTQVLRGALAWHESSAVVVLRSLTSTAGGVALIGLSFVYAVAAFGALKTSLRSKSNFERHGKAAALSSLGVSVVALALLLFAPTATAGSLAAPVAAISAIWLMLSWMLRWPALFTAFQAAVTASVMLAVTARLQTQPWFLAAERPWLDPWTIQAHGVALGALAIAWSLIRALLARWRLRHEQETSSLLDAPWPAFDRVVNVLLLIVFMALAVYGPLPGIAQELTPRKLAAQLSEQAPASSLRLVPPLSAFELPGIPHQHALGDGTWLMGGLLMAALLVGLWERYRLWPILGIVAATAMFCPLLAAQWTPEVAAASALRWIAGSFLLAGSAAIWFREPLARVAARCGWPGWSDSSVEVAKETRTLLLAVVVVLLAVMGAYVSLAAVIPVGFDPRLGDLAVLLTVAFAISAAIALVLFAIANTLLPGETAQSQWRTWARQAGLLVLVLGAAPLVAVSMFVVTTALRGNPIVGPDPASIFARMGLAANYAVPILLIALALVGHALRERSGGFAFAAGLLFNAAAMAGYLLMPRQTPLVLDGVLWVRLAQLNALVSAVYALAWIGVARLGRRSTGASAEYAPGLLLTQVALPIVLVAAYLVPCGVTLWWLASPGSIHAAAGDAMAWSSFAATLLAAVLLRVRGASRFSPAGTYLLLASAATLAAMSMTPWDTGNWLVFHTLLIGHVAAGGLLVSAGAIAAPGSRGTSAVRDGVGRWSAVAGIVVALIALRGAFQDPHGPWWSAGALLVVGLLLATAACVAYRQRLLYLAAAEFNLAASVCFLELAWPAGGPLHFFQGVVELALLNALVLALPAIAWAVIELRVMRPALGESRGYRPLPMHAAAAFGSLLILILTVAAGLLADANHEPLPVRWGLHWFALTSCIAALTACLWDVRLRGTVFGLYLLGLVAVGMTVDAFNLSEPRWLLWTGAMVAAAYALATSYLWSRRQGLQVLADALRIPRVTVAPLSADETSAGWLVAANGVLVCAVLAAAFWVDLTFTEQSLRLLTAKAALFQVVSLGLLARGQRRSTLQAATLLVGVIAAVAWGWAWLDPATTGTLLNRAVVVTASLAATIALYGLGLAKLLPAPSEWTRAAQRLVPLLIALAGASIVFILGAEAIFYFHRGAVPMAPLAVYVVATALAGLAVAGVVAAVVPGRDPLGLPERGRMLYVYGAEVVVALLFLHIRLTRPEWFSGFFSQYWTFIVVLLAFLGVGLSEFFGRRQQRVLAEPLERTGAFLPLLPVLGFWVMPGQSDYSVLLLSVGVLYATLAVMRKSFGFGVLAALAANGGLWYFLYRADGFGLLEHPQLWCIPPAVCVLVAAWLNRDRLSSEQMNSIRYLSMMTVYVSSTADIFLNGVAEAPWLPMVLAGLSLAGIFAGIWLRVRSFLFLGTSFLMLALLTVIWHAAHDLQQTWVWAASGIVAGIMILTLFALFEKKRQEVLQLVDRLKEWE